MLENDMRDARLDYVEEQLAKGSIKNEIWRGSDVDVQKSNELRLAQHRSSTPYLPISQDEVEPPYYKGDGKITLTMATKSMTCNVPKLQAMTIFWWVTALKYLWRWPLKHKDLRDKMKDLQKCIYCIEQLQLFAEEDLHNGKEE